VELIELIDERTHSEMVRQLADLKSRFSYRLFKFSYFLLLNYLTIQKVYRYLI
jgi:hypothetical protein